MSPLQSHAETLKFIKSLSGNARQQALLTYAAPVQKSHWDRGLVLFDLTLALWMASRVALGFVERPIALIPAILALPLTLFIADFFGQAFHKWLDSYASETGFLWGKAAQEFRKHHELPTNLNHVDYLSHISAFGRIMLPMFTIASLINWVAVPALGLNILFLLLVLLHATEIHKQSHRRNTHWFIKRLQKSGIILSYEEHIRHHRAPFDSHFAVINGWSERLTDRIGLWKKADWLWWKFAGELPRIWIQDPRAIPHEVWTDLRLNPRKIPADLLAYASVYPERSASVKDRLGL